MMKKILISMILGAGAVSAFASVQAASGTKLKNVGVERTENTLYLNGEVPLGRVDGSNREVWVTPVLRNGNDSIELGTTVIAGRNRYYQALRHDLEKREGVALVRSGANMKSLPLAVQVPYQKWMGGAEMHVRYETKGCCSDDLGREIVPLGRLDLEPKKFEPVFNWIAPTAEAVKIRELKGQAFIDFPVNKTVIYPDYRGNQGELSRIRATIDTVINDKDVEITALSIKGFASPEGPWNNNVRLAKGRTAALKSYVETLYHFSPDFIQTSYDPEDWGGLRAYMVKSNMADKQAIIALIDSDMEPDAKNSKLQRDFPDAYRFLLANVYPALRHSDYRIEYRVRAFSDVNEIIALSRTRPQNLSLQEFFVAARSLEPGSDDYNELFETAVRMFPESEVANLNAANAAMMRGDMVGAKRYLDCAGEGAEATYARGVYHALEGDYDAANRYFQRAARMKVADAPAALEQLKEVAE